MSASNLKRLATIGGVVAAVAGAFISFGASLVAVLAVVVGWFVARRRGQPLTRGVSWLVAAGSVAVALLMVVAVVASQMPRGSFRNFSRALDSAQTAPPPTPPEWLKKITPPNAQQQTPITNSIIRSRAFTIWTGVMGVSFAVALAAAYAGTLGWGAGLLLLYGMSGSWLPRVRVNGR
ncbi:MAG TPA: hypothetical protein VM076_08500 [Gemmatimonadaceae bacterium]|nr:hypothetical protein [Gemmatimonadaceae bacterium]